MYICRCSDGIRCYPISVESSEKTHAHNWPRIQILIREQERQWRGRSATAEPVSKASSETRESAAGGPARLWPPERGGGRGRGRGHSRQAGAGREHRRVGDVAGAPSLHFLESLLLDRLQALDKQTRVRGHPGQSIIDLNFQWLNYNDANYFSLIMYCNGTSKSRMRDINVWRVSAD